MAWAFLALLASAAVRAVEVDGIPVPERARIGVHGPMLLLNGAGVRTRVILKIYVAALYLPAKTDNAEEILRADRPRRLWLYVLRDFTSEQFIASIDEALNETLTTEQRLPVESRMRQLKAIFEKLRTIRRGMQIVLDYVPQTGTTVTVDGEEKGRIAGADFARALLRVWIGDRPRDPELRKALLGTSPIPQ